MYSDKFCKTLFGYFDQPDVKDKEVGDRSIAVQSKISGNPWIANEATPSQVNAIDRLIARHGIEIAQSLIRAVDSELDFPFEDGEVSEENVLNRQETISAIGANDNTSQEAEDDFIGEIREDLGKLNHRIQAGIGKGIALGAVLVLVKVLYGFNQGIGGFESIFSQNGFIVFAIGFVFGAFAGLLED